MSATDVWVSTGSGKKVYPFAPDKSEFLIEDIARNLSKIVRWSGNTHAPYSVAQHSVHCSNFFRKDRHKALAALLHDASEAYIADIPRPVKAMLPDYKAVEKMLQDAIFVKFGVDPENSDVHSAVKNADEHMLFVERDRLFNNPQVMQPIWDDWVLQRPTFPEFRPVNCYPWTWRASEAKFLKKFNQLTQR